MVQIDDIMENLKDTDNLDETIFINALARISGKSVHDAKLMYDKLIKNNVIQY